VYNTICEKNPVARLSNFVFSGGIIMRSFQFDHTLPPLPIPALSDTCQNLGQVIRPLVDGDTLEKTRRLLDDFEKGSTGPELQRLLMDWRDSRGGNASWLRPFWDDMYLSFRERLPVNMNYGLELTEAHGGKDALPLLIYCLCHALAELRREALPPEPLKDGYLSMDMLRHMIYTRIPHTGRDTLYYPSLSAPMTAAVVCRGHWFILALQYEDGSFLPPSAIKEALTQIEAQGKSLGPAAGVSAFTSAPREQAAAFRAELQGSLLNRTSLESIEKAAFCICLEQDPADQSGFNTSLICGDAANRWFDKSLQIIGTPGGYLGVNIEHAGCDASIWVYLFDWANSILSSQETPDASSSSPSFRLLSWQTGNGLAAKLGEMRQEFRTATRNVALCSRHITSVSRNALKAKKCGPDAFVQLLFQAAYYQLTHRFRSVYEAVSTRSFYQGRTECVRSCTEQSVAFVTAFVEGSASEAELREMFCLAEQAHVQGIRRGQKALGPERHMTGLTSMYKMTEGVIDPPLAKPGIFDSEGYRTLCHTVLSTSSITAPFIGQFCFGPVVEDGIGIGYGLTPDALNLSVSAYSASGIDPAAFVNAFEELSERLLGILD